MTPSTRVVPRPAEPRAVGSLPVDVPHVAMVAAVFGLLAWAGIALTEHIGRIALLWPANGFLLATLLPRATARWRHYLAGAFVANTLVNGLMGDGIPTAVALAACNLVEVLVAGFVLRGRLRALADLSRTPIALRFALVVVLAPLASALLAAAWFASQPGPASWDVIGRWFSADALGLAIVAPLVLAAMATDGVPPLRERWRQQRALLAMLAAASIVVFAQSRFPYLFWLFPPLLIVVLRLGLRGAVKGVAIIAIVGFAATLWDAGPLTAVAPTLREQVLMLQVFVACAALMSFPVALTLAERDRLTRSLEASQGRYRFLAENSRDVILRSTIDGYPLYVSPSVVEMLGWTPEDFLSRKLEEHVHPEDAERAQATFARFAGGSDGDSNIYRVRHRNGSYKWIETSSRVLRDPFTDEPTEFVCAVRDIDERMRQSIELERSNARLQELALIDALTGLGNRRAFDEAVLREWRRAAREHQPLALLLIDVDHFKRYNDCYGHAQGDACLREVADVIRATVQRAADVVTRYGGEEFAVILPQTTRSQAVELAGHLRAAIEARALVHERSPYGVVTACVGVASATPQSADLFPTLFHQADTALYRGKSTGRNKVHVAEAISAEPVDLRRHLRERAARHSARLG